MKSIYGFHVPGIWCAVFFFINISYIYVHEHEKGRACWGVEGKTRSVRYIGVRYFDSWKLSIRYQHCCTKLWFQEAGSFGLGRINSLDLPPYRTNVFRDQILGFSVGYILYLIVVRRSTFIFSVFCEGSTLAPLPTWLTHVVGTKCTRFSVL